MSSEIEFMVDEVIMENDLLIVRGACNAGPVRINDDFDEVYKKTSSISDGEYENGRRDKVRNISLKVKNIITYRHEIEELPTGMTAEISLEGEGVELVNAGDNLGINKN